MSQQKRRSRRLAGIAAEAVLEYAFDGIVTLDKEGRIASLNLAAARMFDCDGEALLGESGTALFHPAAGNESCLTPGRHEVRVRRADGTLFPAEISVSRETGSDAATILLLRDLTERRQEEQKLTYMARYDGLTALPNRRQFHDSLARAMALAERTGTQVALMFLDLDRFKQVNDTLGHDMGDELLRQVAHRFKETVRNYDTILRGAGSETMEIEEEGATVSRLGGDEFTIILKGLAGVDAAASIAERIVGCFEHPFALDGHEVFSSTSIGIALYPRDGGDTDTLIKSADTAMYRAKELGRHNYQFFTREMNEAAQQRIALERDLRHALEREEFTLHFQPKLDLHTDRIYGVEILLRWHHPVRGVVTPYDFMHVLDETGLIVPVGRWVLSAACRQLKQWGDAGLALQGSVNISLRHFIREDLSGDVAQILAETGIDPALLDLELTESLLVEDVEASVRLLGQLRAMGVEVSVDDFGTGYSSLSYLTRFPINALKIDKVFVRDISGNTDGTAVSLAIIGLAHSLGLKAFAEGVETEAELDYLKAHGCDGIQGYLISPPLPAARFEQWLLQHGGA